MRTCSATYEAQAIVVLESHGIQATVVCESHGIVPRNPAWSENSFVSTIQTQTTKYNTPHSSCHAEVTSAVRVPGCIHLLFSLAEEALRLRIDLQ